MAPPTDKYADAAFEDLMEQYVDGSTAAFDALYRRLSPRILGYLLRLTRSRDQSEDLMQITFTKIHRARSSYLRGAPLLPWVFAIARRSFYDDRRSARIRSERVTRDGTLPEPMPTPDAVGNDISEALDRALGTLPEAYREPIMLTKDGGLSISEAADVLGATPTAIKLRIHRGYKLLRKELEAYSRNR